MILEKAVTSTFLFCINITDKEMPVRAALDTISVKKSVANLSRSLLLFLNPLKRTDFLT